MQDITFVVDAGPAKTSDVERAESGDYWILRLDYTPRTTGQSFEVLRRGETRGGFGGHGDERDMMKWACKMSNGSAIDYW